MTLIMPPNCRSRRMFRRLVAKQSVPLIRQWNESEIEMQARPLWVRLWRRLFPLSQPDLL